MNAVKRSRGNNGDGLGCGERRRRLRASDAPISGRRRRQTRWPRRSLNRSDDKDLGFGREILVRESSEISVRERHATARGGAGGGDGAGSSRPISSANEPIEVLQKDFQAMQTHILQVMQDHTLTQYQFREVQCQLNCMEQALMDKLGISVVLVPLRDVPADDSKTGDDLDD
ncbi:hypothetical protein Syun_008592 [Stephania yunnanensis]|uniref:Uncharacterized protein n=1 Tax=Stephania yunnanensis TaxID=152371 RepID=A0AAP0KCW7_9MAGN